MLSSQDIDKKINALYTIEDIVGAMKAYAGVTMRRTDDIVLNIRAYEKNLLLAMADILSHYPDISLKEQDKGKRILVAFGSSQGLCGSFNEKMGDAVSRIITGNDILFVIGKKLKTSLELKQVAYGDYCDSVASIHGIQPALKEAVSKIMNLYKKEDFYKLAFVFTYIYEKKAEISEEQILPPDINKVSALNPARNPPATYMDPRIIFNKILEQFLFISLYRCFVESLRSENWYRLRSMDGASETLKRNLSELNSIQMYTRQEEITEEMLEILGSGMFYK